MQGLEGQKYFGLRKINKDTRLDEVGVPEAISHVHLGRVRLGQHFLAVHHPDLFNLFFSVLTKTSVFIINLITFHVCLKCVKSSSFAIS